MGKSLNGKELGRGITQKGRDLSGKVCQPVWEKTVYAKILNEVRQKLRTGGFKIEWKHINRNLSNSW